jgi:maltooligosyltrehalose trehalohydrolase
VSDVRHFGPFVSDAGVTFRLWAPAVKQVSLLLDAPIDMPKRDGWFELHVAEARPGTRYRFRIDNEIDIADPGSHFQPEDVAGPSEVIDERFDWKAKDWKGRPWHEAVFLESHVGTFTKEGTYRAMIGKLDHLVETGITALELMPIADFPGRWNWGYDGVLLYAPDSSYGRPEDLKALIDAAHQRGLMVFLDVVYNHFGPEGNYLGRLAPEFFSSEHTPWGGAVNYEVPEVRRYAIDSALHWLRDYRFDGLRLDAVHAIVTPGEINVLEELSQTVGQLAAETGRLIHLVLENDDNRAALLAPDQHPPDGRYHAQWNDDYHHAWHVLLTGEDAGYYRDYADPVRHVVRTLGEGFAYQGEPSPHRDGQLRGESSTVLPRAAFVNFLQNHDQIGNRPMGERLTTLVDSHALEAAHAVLLLQPSPPMLFMGEEWGATEPCAVFLRFQGRTCRCRAQWPQKGVRRCLRQARRRDSRSARTRDLRSRPHRLGSAQQAGARQPSGIDARAARRPQAIDRALAAGDDRRRRRALCRSSAADRTLGGGRVGPVAARQPVGRGGAAAARSGVGHSHLG